MLDQTMIEEEPEGVQIRISLRPAKENVDPSLVVPSDPIAVPSSTRRKGLSAVVNHLLDRQVKSDGSDSDIDDDDEDSSKLPSIPFEFIINNKILRTGIEVAARREGLSLEKPVEIQYFPAQCAPKDAGESEKLQDWITAMSHPNERNVSSGDTNSNIFVGGNDGSLRVFRDSFNSFTQVDTINAHSAPIKCMHSLALPDNGNTTNPATILVASGSIDQTLSTHVFSEDRISLHAVYSGGHVTSLSSVALSGTTDTMLASGDWGGGICIWKTPSYTSNLGEIELSEKKRKRASEHNNVEPAISFKAHSNNVSGIVWGHNQSSNSNTIITSSWDHSIKSWDVETRNVLLTLNGSKVVTCIDRCHNSDVVATGQPDCTIRLWDMRTDKVSSNIGSVTDNSLKPR